MCAWRMSGLLRLPAAVLFHSGRGGIPNQRFFGLELATRLEFEASLKPPSGGAYAINDVIFEERRLSENLQAAW